ncbi:MAG: DMT family transporter, partial [Candidatus Aenigmarchaeota archaeon]|nr:DMT family transporter [Candidatus Aenigmarchaeota archaeon]
MEREYWHVVTAGILFGSLIFGASALSRMGLSLYEIAIFFSVFVAISLLPLLILRKEWRPKRKMIGYFALYGFIGFLLNFSDFGSVILGTPVALAILLIYTQPLWTAIFSRIFLKEQITRSKVIVIIMVLMGVFILVNPLTISGAYPPTGIVLALFGGVLLSIWVILGRYFGKLKYSPVTTLFGYTSFRFLFTLAS